ncbi:unnamed protein product [Ixodes pacificus]
MVGLKEQHAASAGRNLTDLDLRGLYKVTGSSLRKMPPCLPCLRRLGLERCCQVPDGLPSYLAGRVPGLMVYGFDGSLALAQPDMEDPFLSEEEPQDTSSEEGPGDVQGPSEGAPSLGAKRGAERRKYSGRQSFKLGRGAATPQRPVLYAAMHQSVLVTIVRHRLRMCQKLLPRPHYRQPVFYLNAQTISYRAGRRADICGDQSILLIRKKNRTNCTQKKHTFIRAGPAIVLVLPAHSSFSSTSPHVAELVMASPSPGCSAKRFNVMAITRYFFGAFLTCPRLYPQIRAAASPRQKSVNLNEMLQ